MDSPNENNSKKLQKYNIDKTPTILVIEGGKVVDRSEGAKEFSETIRILKQEKK